MRLKFGDSISQAHTLTRLAQAVHKGGKPRIVVARMRVQNPEVRPSAPPAEQIAQPPGQGQRRSALLVSREAVPGEREPSNHVLLQEESEGLPLSEEAIRISAPDETTVGVPQNGVEGEIPHVGLQRGVRLERRS